MEFIKIDLEELEEYKLNYLDDCVTVEDGDGNIIYREFDNGDWDIYKYNDEYELVYHETKYGIEVEVL